MSFSSDTKNELVKIENHSVSVCLAELMGLVAFGGKIRRENGALVLRTVTENPKTARRTYQLMKDAAGVMSKISIKKSAGATVYYQVCAENENAITLMMRLGFISKPSDINFFSSFSVNTAYLDKPVKRKAFLRGAFLSCGSVMNPEKKYHMEFAAPTYGLHNDLYYVMKQLSLKPKAVVRKGAMVVYFKSSDEIADILTLMGSYNVLMQFHNVKIIKEIRNDANRTANCEMANVRKMVDASIGQVQAIEKLMKLNLFENLPENLKEVALLRLEYREHSLKELGEMLTPPLGKSGVNHRLRKIQEIADKY